VLIVDLKANKEARDKEGQTALHIVAEAGYEAVVQLLVELGAYKDACDNHGRMVLHLATEKEHKEVVEQLQ